MNSHALTPEVVITTKSLFLIRVDKNELILVDTEQDAKLAIDSIAHCEIKRLETDKSIRTFRRDESSGKNIVICTQALGALIDGPIIETMKIDFIPVNRAQLLRGRHERERDMNILKKTIETIDLEKKIGNTELSLSERKKAIDDLPKEGSAKPFVANSTFASLSSLPSETSLNPLDK